MEALEVQGWQLQRKPGCEFVEENLWVSIQSEIVSLEAPDQVHGAIIN